MSEISRFINIKVDSSDAETGSDKTVKALKKVNKEQIKTQKESKKIADSFDASGKRIARATGKVDKRFKKTTAEIRKTSTAVGRLTARTKGLSATFATLPIKRFLAIAGVGLAIAGATKKFIEFEQSIANLSAITGAVGKDLDFLSKSARELGAITTLSASQVAEAFQLVASAKPDLLSSAESLKEVTKEAIKLAEAAGISVPDAANTMASALNQFGKDADQAARFTNVLAAGSKFGAASIAEMGEALKFAGVASANFGLSFEDTNAALQLLSTNAIKGGEAGTQLKGVLLNLETKMSSEFRPSVVGLSTALENLKNANLTAEESTKLFGTRNFIAGKILSNNTELLKELTKNVTGTKIAQEQATIRTNTFQGANKRLGSALEELALVLTGDTGIGNALSSLVDSLASATLAIAAFFQGVETGTQQLKRLNGENETLQKAFEKFSVNKIKTSLEGLNKIVDKNNKKMNTLRGILAKGGNATGVYAEQILELSKSNASANRSLIALKAALVAVTEAQIENAEETENAKEKIQQYTEESINVLEALQEEINALGRTNEEQLLYNALKEAGAEANSKTGLEIKALVSQLVNERNAIEQIKQAEDSMLTEKKNAIDKIKQSEKEAADETRRLQKETKKLADQADPFSRVWEGALIRIDKAFVDTWKGAFNSFEDFAKSLKNAFLQLLAELANALITRPLIQGVIGGLTGIFGGLAGASSGAGAAAGTLGNGLGSPGAIAIGNATSSLTGAVSLGAKAARLPPVLKSSFGGGQGASATLGGINVSSSVGSAARSIGRSKIFSGNILAQGIQRQKKGSRVFENNKTSDVFLSLNRPTANEPKRLNSDLANTVLDNPSRAVGRVGGDKTAGSNGNAVQINVNVENSISNAKVEVAQSKDGRTLNIVINEIVKTGISSGIFDKTLSQSHGLKRRGN